MENDNNHPFKIGELCESKSFQSGYRGAWFRCKIIDIKKRKGHTQVLLEHYDYPDEKPNWTRLYQLAPQSKGKQRELMLRPSYPPIYNEKEMPDVDANPEVAVIVNDSWEVGDLVDWWTSDCYWSGRILELLGDGKAKLELHPPPLGEGLLYEIFLKDVRPSLEWSQKFGWKLSAKETGRSCARLIKPINQVTSKLQCNGTYNAGQEAEADELTSGSSLRLSPSSLISADSLVASDEVKSTGTTHLRKQLLGSSASKEPKDKSTSLGHLVKTNCTETASGLSAADEDLDMSSPLKKYIASGRDTLHSLHSDTLEAAILDLEEYATKVKWLKRILKCGTSPLDNSSPQWKFCGPNVCSEIPK